ncbi:hypothetical protein CK203_043861 [Vitis vinifera]|uniref:Uncharacterized protein n=1 Tax=Vitis vinifera TaxID=29760 RepID=A0A438HVH0_VITVI|nr:hypothetical protein CK203_043861 [Vitis vinifera]
MDADWSPNFEDLYSPELDFRIFVWRAFTIGVAWDARLKVESRICAYGCSIPSHSGHLYDSRDLIIHPDFRLPPQDHELIESGITSLEENWKSIDQSRFTSEFRQFSRDVRRASFHTCFYSGVHGRVPHIPQTTQVLPLGTSHGVPFHLSDHCETTPPPIVAMSHPIVNTTNDTRLTEQEARVERLEARVRQVRLQDEGLTWDDRNGIPAASLPAKFRMPNIERYSGIGCPKIHLRLYNTAMRSHGIDDAQLVALFPMSLSGADQR